MIKKSQPCPATQIEKLLCPSIHPPYEIDRWMDNNSLVRNSSDKKMHILFAKKRTSLFAEKGTWQIAKNCTFLFAKNCTLLFTVYRVLDIYY